MIRLKQPSLVLHAYDVPGYKYRMWKNWIMPELARPIDVVNWILNAYNQTPEYNLRNVVINAHGLSGKIYIGGDNRPTLNNYNVGVFQQLRGKADIGTIWIVACKVAQGAAGKYFCENLAKSAGCRVVAADVNQHVNQNFCNTGCPWGCIDNFEGMTYCWDGSGKMSRCSQDGSDVPGVFTT